MFLTDSCTEDPAFASGLLGSLLLIETKGVARGLHGLVAVDIRFFHTRKNMAKRDSCYSFVPVRWIVLDLPSSAESTEH